jgi:hypothetical protein
VALGQLLLDAGIGVEKTGANPFHYTVHLPRHLEVEAHDGNTTQSCLNDKGDIIVLPFKYGSRIQDQRHDS